ncbi:MAG: hypothetical protein RBT86_09920 [Azospira sp.]|jgi:hypothetical protein|nr:hypothetical protein [Azospira sp.]
MKFLFSLLLSRLRAGAFRLLARGLTLLLPTLLASRLRPAHAHDTMNRHRPAGRTLHGEYRRLDN